MSRVIHDLQQGSIAWHQHRSSHDNASDAPAMLGLSQHVTRTDFVRARALGEEREVTANDQKRFDDGHAFEAMARPWAEEIVGEDLYPITASLVVEGLSLSASYDGATIGEDMVFEHKTLNQELAASLERCEIPDAYHPQMEQQLLILGATRCLFMASNGTRESMKFAWYESNPVLRSTLIAGWKQFHEDVKNYVHVETVPKATATLRAGLPAVVIDVTGSVALESNLDKLGAALRFYVDAIPAKPATDEDFANCEQAVKDLKTAEERLEAAEAAALARFESVEAMRTLVASMIDLARTTRLRTDRLVKDRKEAIRAEILASAKATFAEHVAKLNQRLGRPFMPVVPCDFAGAMRAKKTVAGLHDAVNVMLASGKIAANEIADRIQVNLACLAELGKGYEGLFADLHELCLKTEEHFRLVVQSRIAEEDNKRAAERERIRAEEEAKAVAKVEAQRPAPTPAPHAPPTQLRPAPRHTTRPRPTDAEIIAALAQHFNATQQDVVAWLSSFASTTFAA